MLLYFDHYYTIGKAHTVCEDFVMQGDRPTPFIILSDGCSGSRNTDIGARILALTTEHLLGNASHWPLDYTVFGRELINRAWNVADRMQLDNNVLDATVMLAFLHQESILVYVYGDGCLLFVDYKGNVGFIEIAFTHNAPYYLTYWHDEERWQEYARYDPKPLFLMDSVNGRSAPLTFQTPLVFSFELKKFQKIAISSDGASHFVNTLQYTRIPIADVAMKLMAFQTFEGEFVKNHLESSLQEWAKAGIYPLDDLSIGIFVVPKNN